MAVTGLTPSSNAEGTSALAVAACEYSSMLAKKNTTASSQGDCCRMVPETALMSSMWALMKVSPSQATPRMQMQALMPDLKVAVEVILPVSMRHSRQISVAAESMNTMMASLRGSTGFWISPTLSLISVAYSTTAMMAARKMATDFFAPGRICMRVSPRSVTKPLARRSW